MVIGFFMVIIAALLCCYFDSPHPIGGAAIILVTVGLFYPDIPAAFTGIIMGWLWIMILFFTEG